MTTARHRTIEDTMAIVGLVIITLYSGAEILHRAGVQFGPNADHGFPWGVFLMSMMCILPKTVGRATAGRIWDKLGSNLKPGDK